MNVICRLSDSEHERRSRRKQSYHLIAPKNKLPNDPYDEADFLFDYLISPRLPEALAETKKELILDLAKSGGDVDADSFQQICLKLERLAPKPFDASRVHKSQRHRIQGMWIEFSRPKYKDCCGQNKNGDYMYTLGRMSFDMIRPTGLKCSIQGVFNPVHLAKRGTMDYVPRSLADELKDRTIPLRTYDIVTAFTVEEANKPLEGILTTTGFIFANHGDEHPNRLSIWFTGGILEPVHDEDLEEWKRIFQAPAMRKLKERARVIGAKIAFGAKTSDEHSMEEDGRLCYHLTRPTSRVYIDVLYIDETVRVVRTSMGAIHVLARVPYFPDE